MDVFDADGLFDRDYLHFYGDALDEDADLEVEVVWRLLGLDAGAEVLDLACGHGRIANRLAARGCRVTGIDATPLFLERARDDAAARGVPVEYVEGDMRELPEAWTGRFAAVVNWFTAFGYFDDTDNRRVLAEAARVLAPGGQLALDLNNRDWIARHFQAASVLERDDDLVIDQRHLEPLTGRVVTVRTVVRDGQVRRVPFFVRLYGFTELRDHLLAEGFTAVHAYGDESTPLGLDSRRMIAVARR